jgi:hypothetical protein
VPQRCLGEILTVTPAGEHPPEQVRWRGELLPVADFGFGGSAPWRDERSGAGLIAVVLGQRDEACPYFGVALRGSDLGVRRLEDAAIEDLPDAVEDYACAMFSLQGTVYEVPDLLALQRSLGSGEWFTGCNNRQAGL